MGAASIDTYMLEDLEQKSSQLIPVGMNIIRKNDGNAAWNGVWISTLSVQPGRSARQTAVCGGDPQCSTLGSVATT